MLVGLAATPTEFAEVDNGLLVLRWWLWSEGEEEDEEDMGLAATLGRRWIWILLKLGLGLRDDYIGIKGYRFESIGF